MSSNVIIGLDIGTSFVRAAIGEMYDDGSVGIRGVASLPSSSFMRRGVIINPQSAVECIQRVLEDVQEEANCRVDTCVTAIGGEQIQGRDERGSVGISPLKDKTNRTVTEDDVQRVLESAKSVPYTPDRRLISVIPKEYIIDNIRGFTHETALNTIAARLSVEVYLITASSTQYENLRQCVERSGLFLNDVVVKSIACADATMVSEEQKAGSILIDFGGGTTDVLVVLNNAPICAFSIPVGGERVTRDIAEVEGIPFEVAEDLKLRYGCCWKNPIDDDIEIPIPGIGSQPGFVEPRSKFREIIQCRLAEILRNICDHLERSINADITGSIVLTGGGANMSGIVELTKCIFNFESVRIGRPGSFGGLEEKYRTPEFATAVGLVISGVRSGAEADFEPKKAKKQKAPSEKSGGKSVLKKAFDLMFGF